jgi:hypothetical protein
MRIMVVGIHYAVCSARYISDAFKRLGHDVKHVGEYQTNNIWGIQVDPKHNWIPNASKEDAIEGWEPDLIVISESAYQFHHPVYSDAPHVIFGMDNHVRKYWQPGIEKYFLAHYCPSIMEWTDECVRTPCGYDPEVFVPSSIAWEDRQYDIGMVGVLYPRRVEIVQAMAEAGLKVWAGMGPLYEDYAAIYHNARISLCVSAAGDVAQRIFECSAMGNLILSDRCKDFGRLGFKPWEHYVPYENTVSAVQGARMMLNTSPQAALDIVSKSLEWARPHTWDTRCEMILDTIFGGN